MVQSPVIKQGFYNNKKSGFHGSESRGCKVLKYCAEKGGLLKEMCLKYSYSHTAYFWKLQEAKLISVPFADYIIYKCCICMRVLLENFLQGKNILHKKKSRGKAESV